MALSAEDEDLLGAPPAPEPERPKQKLRLCSRGLDGPKSLVGRGLADVTLDQNEVVMGVTINWLMAVLNMRREPLRERLIGCPIIGQNANVVTYNLAKVIDHLAGNATGKIAAGRELTEDDLPEDMRKDYWDRKMKRLNYEQKAGDLWHVEDIRKVNGEALAIIKDKMMMWPDQVERLIPEAAKKRKQLTQICDTVQDDIYQALLIQAKTKRTPSYAERDTKPEALPADV